jgi:hypothetical protein
VLARHAYQRALAAARVAPTPRRWRKLLTAAKNLRAATRDAERRWLVSLTPAARALAPRAAGRRGAVLLPFPCPRAGRRWPELVRVWEWSRALLEQSERLVAEARLLRDALLEQVARRGAPARAVHAARPRSRGRAATAQQR